MLNAAPPFQHSNYKPCTALCGRKGESFIPCTEAALEYLTEKKFYPLGTTDEYCEAPYEEHPITICGQTVILTNGEPEALDEVLRHYSKRIRIAAIENGHINRDTEDGIKSRLVAALFKFRFDEQEK